MPPVFLWAFALRQPYYKFIDTLVYLTAMAGVGEMASVRIEVVGNVTLTGQLFGAEEFNNVVTAVRRYQPVVTAGNYLVAETDLVVMRRSCRHMAHAMQVVDQAAPVGLLGAVL